MRAKCTRCGVMTNMCAEFVAEAMTANRKKQRELFDAVVCEVCADNTKVRPTALGALALACHVGHISQQLPKQYQNKSNENWSFQAEIVSRETINTEKDSAE